MNNDLQEAVDAMLDDIRTRPDHQTRVEELLYLSMLFMITLKADYGISETSPLGYLIKEIKTEIGSPAEYAKKYYGAVIGENDNDFWS